MWTGWENTKYWYEGETGRYFFQPRMQLWRPAQQTPRARHVFLSCDDAESSSIEGDML